MSYVPWSDLDGKKPDERIEEHREKATALAKNYARCFETEHGQKVLEDMVNSFIMDNGTSLSSPNVNYEAAYRNGEAGAVRYILNQIKRASIL